MKNLLKKMMVAVLGLVLMLFVSGCNSDAPSETSTGGAAADSTEDAAEASSETYDIKVAEFRGSNWIAAYIAEALGYYDEEGLNVEFILYKDGPPAFQGMVQGDSNFTLLSQEPVLKAANEGLESSIVYSVLDNRAYSFALGPDVESVEDLKGAQIFAGLPGSAPYSFVSTILEEHGLNPKRDVTFLNMDYGAAIPALSNGEIAASYINTDNKIEVENSGLDVTYIADTGNPDDSAKYLGSDDFPGEIIVVNKQFKDENPEAVQKYINAISKATEWINTNDAEVVAEELMSYYDSTDLETLTKRVEIIQSMLTDTGYISEEGQQTVVDFALKTEVISEPVAYEDLIDMTFVDAYQENK